MHKLTAILATLALSTSGFSGSVSAAPRKHNPRAKADRAATERFVLACVDERTGPDGGIDTDEAFKLCKGIVRHNAKIAKLAKRANDAKANGATPRLVKRLELECAEEVSIACEDTTERDHDGGECSDATLESKHAFDVCRGKAPVAASKEGK